MAEVECMGDPEGYWGLGSIMLRSSSSNLSNVVPDRPRCLPTLHLLGLVAEVDCRGLSKVTGNQQFYPDFVITILLSLLLSCSIIKDHTSTNLLLQFVYYYLYKSFLLFCLSS